MKRRSTPNFSFAVIKAQWDVGGRRTVGQRGGHALAGQVPVCWILHFNWTPCARACVRVYVCVCV